MQQPMLLNICMRACTLCRAQVPLDILKRFLELEAHFITGLVMGIAGAGW